MDENRKIRVLWFTNTPANADEFFQSELKGTGGWLKSLDKEMQSRVELHVAFYKDYCKSFKYLQTTYHPIKRKNVYLTKALKNIGINLQREKIDLDKYLKIVEIVKPDIVHIHGTENYFSNIIKFIKVPVVVSIQGNITIYYHKYLSGFEKKFLKVGKRKSFNVGHILFPMRFSAEYRKFDIMARNERVNLLNTKYVIGRTDWDRRITRILAPDRKYFHNDEILRNSFYENSWEIPYSDEKFILHTTNGNNYYKGFETLCQTLNLLNYLKFKCEWRIAGISENDLIVKLAKRKLGKCFPTKGLILLGSLTEYDLVSKMNEANVYVMVSHIENSPNNLCEAMILGMPCISTFVGGCGTLIDDNNDGIFVQSGDPWAMAGAIIELATDKEEALRLGQNARKKALLRHDKERIANELVYNYHRIIEESKEKL